MTQTQLHVLTRLRRAKDFLARLDKAHSVEDYADLYDFAARARVFLARDAEVSMRLASFAAEVERAAGELLQTVRNRVAH